jgi:hypothetical protein
MKGNCEFGGIENPAAMTVSIRDSQIVGRRDASEAIKSSTPTEKDHMRPKIQSRSSKRAWRQNWHFEVRKARYYS